MPLVADTLRGIARQHAPPSRCAGLRDRDRADAGGPSAQHRGRGRETLAPRSWRWRSAPGCAAAEIAALVWDDITPTACAGQTAGPRARLEGQRRRPPRGPAAARRRGRTRRRAGCARRPEPAAGERVVPLSPHQVNRRIQEILAAALGLEGRLVALRTPRPSVGAGSAAARRPPPCRPPGSWRSAAIVARYASAVAVEDGAVARLLGGMVDTP